MRKPKGTERTCVGFSHYPRERGRKRKEKGKNLKRERERVDLSKLQGHCHLSNCTNGESSREGKGR